MKLVSQAGLEAIEWGGDIHVPHGDLEAARDAARLTVDAGINTAFYGSYYRVAASEEEGLSFQSVLDTAVELGAPLIRVWAGRRSSDEADDAYRGMVVEDSCRIADMASSAGITIAYELHSRTLTDTNDSAVRLLREVAHNAVLCYWQPSGGTTEEYCMAGLEAVLPRLANIHVFHWGETHKDRRPLEEGYEQWRRYLTKAGETGCEHYALLEFVKDDDPEMFLQDAATLKQIISDFS